MKRQRPDPVEGPIATQMGSGDGLRQERSFQPIVAFDFDGTLTTRDSFTGFLAWRAGQARYAAGLVGLAPALGAYLLRRDRGRLKAAALSRFLKGVSRNELDASARLYAASEARKLLRPDAVRVWKRWQGLGAHMVIVTASPEPVVAPFARELGCDLLLGTRLEFDFMDRLTGRFEGPNCRGEEKVRRLRAAFGPDVRLNAAYGDTSGDHAMLKLADEQGLNVFKETP